MAATGMDAAAVEAAMATRGVRAKPADDVELDADDEGRSVSLFLALDTQWCWATAGVGMGVSMPVRVGLNYVAIEPTARMWGVELAPWVMADLRVMEAEALRALAEQARRA